MRAGFAPSFAGMKMENRKKRYALIGGAVAHSLSPSLHAMIGACEYELCQVREEAQLAELLRDTRYDGFNVTVPYKECVLPLLDVLSEEARAIGAVNTISRLPDSRLKGDNTDGFGFRQLFAQGAVLGRTVLVLGTGGAACAVAHALRLLGAASVVFVSRDPERASAAHPAWTVIGYEELAAHRFAEILVNATPVGMYPEILRSPLDGITPLDFPALRIAVDLVYHPYRSKFLQDAARGGAECISGLAMLVWQGLRSRAIWEGRGEDEEGRFAACHAEEAERILRRLLRAQLNLVTIGMPGSGKSSISRQVALHLKRPFFDSDRTLQAAEKRSVKEILQQDGEGTFRDLEAKTVEALCREGGRVIATGGGSVLRPENRTAIRVNSVVVYLRRAPEKLATKNRPLSQANGPAALLAERARFYEETADLVIKNDRTFGGNGPRDANKKGEKRGGQSFYMRDIRRFARKIAKAAVRFIDEAAAHDAAGVGRKES